MNPGHNERGDDHDSDLLAGHAFRQAPRPGRRRQIVWLGSEVMFFAGLFAIYFTLRSTSPTSGPKRRSC